MFDKRNRLSFQVAEEVERHFPDLLLKTRIPRNVRLAESPSHGKPAILFDVQSTGARAHLELAEEVLTRLPAIPSPAMAALAGADSGPSKEHTG